MLHKFMDSINCHWCCNTSPIIGSMFCFVFWQVSHYQGWSSQRKPQSEERTHTAHLFEFFTTDQNQLRIHVLPQTLVLLALLQLLHLHTQFPESLTIRYTVFSGIAFRFLSGSTCCHSFFVRSVSVSLRSPGYQLAGHGCLVYWTRATTHARMSRKGNLLLHDRTHTRMVHSPRLTRKPPRHWAEWYQIRRPFGFSYRKYLKAPTPFGARYPVACLLPEGLSRASWQIPGSDKTLLQVYQHATVLWAHQKSVTVFPTALGFCLYWKNLASLVQIRV